jgi:hypothetical protein
MIFNDALKFGLGGERIVAEMFKAKGWVVVQVGGQHGAYQGPRIELPLGLVQVCPDLIVMNGAKALWIEVKRKSQFAYHRNSKTFVTGVDLHHWKEYLANDLYGSFPMWLFFVHETSSVHSLPFGESAVRPRPGLYFERVRWMESHKHHEYHNHGANNFGNHGGIFWDVTKLKFVPLPALHGA